jgi:hypothetical protein
MLGDVTQKTGSKAKAFMKKNAKGKSFKHIDKPKNGDPSGSDAEVDGPAKRMSKGMNTGPGTRDRQNPKEQRSFKPNCEGAIEDWCAGKRSTYK